MDKNRIHSRTVEYSETITVICDSVLLLSKGNKVIQYKITLLRKTIYMLK